MFISHTHFPAIQKKQRLTENSFKIIDYFNHFDQFQCNRHLRWWRHSKEGEGMRMSPGGGRHFDGIQYFSFFLFFFIIFFCLFSFSSSHFPFLSLFFLFCSTFAFFTSFFHFFYYLSWNWFYSWNGFFLSLHASFWRVFGAILNSTGSFYGAIFFRLLLWPNYSRIWFKLNSTTALKMIWKCSETEISVRVISGLNPKESGNGKITSKNQKWY